MTTESNIDHVSPHSSEEDEAWKIAQLAAHFTYNYGEDRAVKIAYSVLNNARRLALKNKEERWQQYKASKAKNISI